MISGNFVKLFTFALLAVVQAIDYCTIPSCKPNTHIACNNNGAFASICDTPKAIPLSAAQKQQIIDLTNFYRNQVASGQLSGFSSARRMAKVVWDDDLASFAVLNTKQCKMQHDPCHNTVNLNITGQNLAWMANTGSYSTEAVINGSLAMWFNEYKFATMVDINKLTRISLPDGSSFGHFTALVNEKATRIGCGVSSYRTLSGTTWFNAYLLACNYAYTNMITCPVYTAGPAASGCTQGPDATYKGLCKTTEPINPNSYC